MAPMPGIGIAESWWPVPTVADADGIAMPGVDELCEELEPQAVRSSASAAPAVAAAMTVRGRAETVIEGMPSGRALPWVAHRGNRTLRSDRGYAGWGRRGR